MTVLSSWRRRLARAVERGDPRLGLGVGIVLSLLAAWAFAAPRGLAKRAEDAVLDTAFQWREPIRESDRILLVDIMDQTIRQLGWPVTRAHYGQAVLALDRLGAREILFDVQFKSTAVRPDQFDPATGDYRLSDDDKVLRHAIGAAGNVTLSYNLEVHDPLSPEIRGRLPAILELLRRDFSMPERDLAGRAGLDPEMLAKEAYGLREQAAVALVGELLEREPALTFAAVRERFLAEGPAGAPELLKILQFAYWSARGEALLARKLPRIEVEARPPGTREAFGIVPPYYPFLERARSAASVNSQADAEDGVLRRPWSAVWYRGRPHLYLGLAGTLGAGGATIRERSIRLRVPEEVELPVDREGRILVNWAGNRSRKRGMAEPAFAHVPLHEMVSFYEDRYVFMDDNFRRTIAEISEGSGEPYHPEYAALSLRLGRILRGEEAAAPEEARSIEAALDAHREAVLADISGEIATIEKALPSITAQRARESSEKELRRLRELRAGLRHAYDREERLRPLVEGRLCWIGSANTASGDLHPTPLGANTPGVDVLANVANMALTGQAVRKAPAPAVFGFLLAAGVLVSLAVGHWRTSWAAAATAGLVAASLGLYWALFTRGSLLLSGAGPAGTAALVFAGTTAFKELVTERSRRKLEKELVKNTSAELVAILMERPELLREPRKMTGSFFFSDIKSFTSISEKMSPEVLVPFINRYLDRMTSSLKAHRGYLDKYIGDGIMALFGVPVASPDHARDACRAALENQALLEDLNREFERDGLPRIRVRVGINSGEVIAGYVGAADRSDYTVLGDAVNLAARLEGANKEYGTSVLASEFTQRLVASEFVFRELDRIRVVGKENAVGIYELAAVAGGPAPFPGGFLEAYRAALVLFRDRRWGEAIEAFGKALALKPADRPSEVYLERARGFLESPPPPGWEGVFELSSK